MTRSVVCALIFVLASAMTAQAGAWLRGKGSSFFSSSVSTNQSDDLSTSVYLEYGLTEHFTVGADIYYGVERTSFQEGAGVVFLRFPLGPTDRPNKFAAHVGAGARYLYGNFSPAFEVGVSWGRGIQIGERYGWLNVDASFNTPRTDDDPYYSDFNPADRYKLDGTFGLGLTERSKVMFQVFNTFENEETYTTLAPSYLFSMNAGKSTFQFGLEIPTYSGGETALKIGIWREF